MSIFAKKIVKNKPNKVYIKNNLFLIWRIVVLIRQIRGFLVMFLFGLYSIKCFRSGIKILASPWWDYRIFENISNYAKYNQVHFLFKDHQNLYYCEPVFNHKNIIKSIKSLGNHYFYAAVLDIPEVIGGSSLILLNDNKVLYDFASHNKDGRYRYTDEGIRYYKDDFCIVNADRITNNVLVEGIFMCGNYSWNYYHLIFETLVKFEQIDALGLDANIPLLIDKVCMDVPQYLELFTILNKQHRKLIPLERGTRYLIQKLYYISCPNFLPQSYFNDRSIKAEDFLFDLRTIQYLRLNLLPYSSKKVFPKRIFISRSNVFHRRKFNEDIVFNELSKEGFEEVFPEKYSIADQIALFSGAEFIAGGSGAAFANLLFCNQSCKVVVFTKNDIPFSGFATIANFIGLEMIYITDDSSNNNSISDIHDSFQINIDKLHAVLAGWI